MTQFAIYEGNMPKLMKKIERIRNKCNKYGCDFHFAETGEEFRRVTLKDGRDVVVRSVIVEAEGTAIVNGWKFIGSVEHTEKGNIIRKIADVKVPDKYYTTDPICEHCHTNRYRKDTYIIMNDSTGEFKQVGKACLKDFTGGMSIESATQYMSLLNCLEEESNNYSINLSSVKFYVDTREYLRYVAEAIKHFGFVRTDCGYSTKDRALDYFNIEHDGKFTSNEEARIKSEMKAVSFNANDEDNYKLVDEALNWLNNTEYDSDYIYNLKVACSLDYVSYRHLGIVASIFPTYTRELEHLAKLAEREEAAKNSTSKYVGSIGDRVVVCAESIECITSWPNQFGVTRLYKIVDKSGNVYIWKTGNFVDETSGVTIRGTVKSHNEYEGILQTELTRCKIA